MKSLHTYIFIAVSSLAALASGTSESKASKLVLCNQGQIEVSFGQLLHPKPGVSELRTGRLLRPGTCQRVAHGLNRVVTFWFTFHDPETGLYHNPVYSNDSLRSNGLNRTPFVCDTFGAVVKTFPNSVLAKFEKGCPKGWYRVRTSFAFDMGSIDSSTSYTLNFQAEPSPFSLLEIPEN